MVALKRLTWPHLVPSKRSQSSLKSSTSRDSVKEAVLDVETQQKPQHRVTSDEDQTRTEYCPCFSPDCIGIQSQARSYTVAIKDHATSSHKITKFWTDLPAERLSTPAFRDLVQSNPDTPIGGEMAPPMKQRSFNVGTLAMDHGQTPRIKISPPSIPSDGKKPLRWRSNLPDLFEAPPTFLGWDKLKVRVLW